MHQQFRFREKSEHFVGRWVPRTDGIHVQTPVMPSAWCLSVGMFMMMERQPDMCLSHELKDQTQPLGYFHLKFEEITKQVFLFAYYWEFYVSRASTLVWKLSLTNRFQITWVFIVSQYDNLVINNWIWKHFKLFFQALVQSNIENNTNYSASLLSYASDLALLREQVPKVSKWHLPYKHTYICLITMLI